MTLWTGIRIVVKSAVFLMALVLSAYVLLYGKKKTGIKRDYVATMVFLFILLAVI